MRCRRRFVRCCRLRRDKRRLCRRSRLVEYSSHAGRGKNGTANDTGGAALLLHASAFLHARNGTARKMLS
eukprot:372898-Lingulodinium_polyedra.AAC.1